MGYEWLAPLMFIAALLLIFSGYPVAFALGGTSLVFAFLGVASGFFLVGYGSLRFVTEFFRSPDAHIGYVLGGFITMGQLLSLPLVLLGLFLLFWLPQNVRRGKRNETVS